MNFDVDMYLPLRLPFRGLLSKEGMKRVEAQREIFLNELPYIIADGWHRASDISTPQFIETPEEISAIFSQLSPIGSVSQLDVAHLSASVELEIEELQQANQNRLTPDLFPAIAAISVAEMVEKALALSEISYPGSVCTMDGVCFSAGSWQRIESKSWFCALAEPDSLSPSWPSLEPMSLVTVYNWAKKIGFGREAVATSRISRMIAAYTHVIGLGQNNEGEVLFRAMQGLEAFFCDGVGDLRKQLADKLELWIGPIQDKSHSIGKLYEVRSKFVHGSSYIDYYRHGMDIPEQEAKSSRESEFASTYAVRLLVATLQNCIKRDVESILWKFDFETRC